MAEIPEAFKNVVREDVLMFQDLLQSYVNESLRKELMYGFRVPNNTISGIIRDVCKAIVAIYAGDVKF